MPSCAHASTEAGMRPASSNPSKKARQVSSTDAGSRLDRDDHDDPDDPYSNPYSYSFSGLSGSLDWLGTRWGITT